MLLESEVCEQVDCYGVGNFADTTALTSVFPSGRAVHFQVLRTQMTFPAFIPYSVLRQVRRLFQRENASECDLVRSPSIFSILSFP